MGTPRPGTTYLSDEDHLVALDLKASDWTLSQIAHRLKTTRSAVAGAIQRALLSCPPDPRHDGTMPRYWWKAGLQVEGRNAR